MKGRGFMNSGGSALSLSPLLYVECLNCLFSCLYSFILGLVPFPASSAGNLSPSSLFKRRSFHLFSIRTRKKEIKGAPALQRLQNSTIKKYSFGNKLEWTKGSDNLSYLENVGRLYEVMVTEYSMEYKMK
jgi:hypothetical protein